MPAAELYGLWEIPLDSTKSICRHLVATAAEPSQYACFVNRMFIHQQVSTKHIIGKSSPNAEKAKLFKEEKVDESSSINLL